MRVAPIFFPDRSYESGFLAGSFDGEGSLSTTKGGIRFAQNENAMMVAVKRALTERNYTFVQYNKTDTILNKQIYLNGGLKTVMRFLMECRPPRLLEKWQRDKMGGSLYNMEKVQIEKVEYIGKFPCVTLMTDTGTYIAEGFGAHNTFKTVAFIWDKGRMGMGYWTRKQAEICYMFTRGKPVRLSKGVRQMIVAPRREHSRKPAQIHERIEALVEGPYLECFAREPTIGWTIWGDQTDRFNSSDFTNFTLANPPRFAVEHPPDWRARFAQRA